MNLSINIYWACLSLLVAVALSRGGRPEQYAGAALVVGAALSLASAPDPVTSFQDVEWDLFAVDLLSFGCFLFLSLRANRWWPMCVCGAKLIPICAHLAKWANPELARMTYGWVTGAWGYLNMLVVAIAVVRHQARLRRHGKDLPWRDEA